MKEHKKLIVVKKNELLRASYSLSLSEQRMLLAIISQLDSMAEADRSVIWFTTDEMYQAYEGEIQRDTIYKAMKSTAEKLFDRTIVLHDRDKPNNKIMFRWVQSVTYKDGHIGVTLSNNILPYLKRIKENFTKYDLADISRFKSSHTIRFYEWFKQYEGVGHLQMTIEDLRKRLDLVKQYSLTHHLKTMVIDKALHEINEYTDMMVNYKLNKKGAKYESVKFIIKSKKEIRKFSNPKPYIQNLDRTPEQKKNGLMHISAIMASLKNNQE